MTQEDLQRDVEMLQGVADTIPKRFAEHAAVLRAIETARILASMSDDQVTHVRRTAEGLVTANNEAADVSERRPHGIGAASMYRDRADAHRKVARLMGGAT